VVTVYATAYHRAAQVAAVDERVYVVLSGVSGPAGLAARRRAAGSGPGWVADAVAAIRARLGPGWRAGIGSPVPTLAALADTRAEADRVLDVLHRTPDGPAAATITDLRAEVLLSEVLEVLTGRPELRHPGIAALAGYDADSGGALVASLLAYLDALGDVRAASAALHVHPNTLRHRLRRARAVSGVAWDDPRERLAGHLELVLLRRGSRNAP
jgi:sugar diacid utilization regulator